MCVCVWCIHACECVCVSVGMLHACWCTVCVEGGGECVHVCDVCVVCERETSKGYLDQYKGEFEFHHFLKHHVFCNNYL